MPIKGNAKCQFPYLRLAMVVHFLIEIVLELIVHLIVGLFELVWHGLVRVYEFIYVKILKRL